MVVRYEEAPPERKRKAETEDPNEDRRQVGGGCSVFAHCCCYSWGQQRWSRRATTPATTAARLTQCLLPCLAARLCLHPPAPALRTRAGPCPWGALHASRGRAHSNPPARLEDAWRPACLDRARV